MLKKFVYKCIVKEKEGKRVTGTFDLDQSIHGLIPGISPDSIAYYIVKLIGKGVPSPLLNPIYNVSAGNH